MKQLFLCDDCELDAVAVLCKEYGYGIEVQSFYDPSYLERESGAIERHLRALAGIAPRALHGPFGDLVPGSFDAMVRGVARYRFEQAVEVARALDIQRIILHHGYVPGAGMADRWSKSCVVFWKDFLRDKEPGLHFHIENVFERDPSMLAGLVDMVDDARVSLCLDIGHVGAFGKANPVEWINVLGSRIGYVHLHDNHGEKDEHLGLGEGTAPIAEACEALEAYAPEAIWALEARVPSLRSSLEWLAARHTS